MLEKEKLDIVAVATNTKGRSHFTCMASNLGAKGIFTEKPMAHTLAEVDEMVATCAKNGTALSCGAISTTHPSFEILTVSIAIYHNPIKLISQLIIARNS